MARTPFPFSVCKECAGSGGGETGGGGLTEADVIEIIRENAQDHTGKDGTLPPSFDGMVEYVGGCVGSIETALDNIISIQNSLIGGGSV